MTKLCECGCGQPAPVGARTQAGKGLRVGEPLRFINGHQNRKPLEYAIQDCGYETPCWVWMGSVANTGYGHFTRENVRYATHRWSWEKNCGPIPEGLYVCHHCDNRRCIRPDHLFLGTCADNIHDAKAKGRLRGGSGRPNPPRGEKNPAAKLKDEDISVMCRQYRQGGVSQRALAKQFGVSRGIVVGILKGKRWAHIPR